MKLTRTVTHTLGPWEGYSAHTGAELRRNWFVNGDPEESPAAVIRETGQGAAWDAHCEGASATGTLPQVMAWCDDRLQENHGKESQWLRWASMDSRGRTAVVMTCGIRPSRLSSLAGTISRWCETEGVEVVG